MSRIVRQSQKRFAVESAAPARKESPARVPNTVHVGIALNKTNPIPTRNIRTSTRLALCSITAILHQDAKDFVETDSRT